MSVYPLLQLGDIAEVVAGDPAPQDPRAFASDGPLFVRMQDVGRHHRHPALSDSADRLSSDWLAQNRLRLFPKDSILIPKSGASVNLNHRAKLAIDAYVVSHLAILIPDRTRIEPDYLYWWSAKYDPRAQAQVTSLPSLKLSTLKSALVPLPPLDEQRRIVGILNRATRIERLRAQARDRLQEFIPALFVKMFGDPATNPMGWPVERFSELVVDTTRNATKIKRKDYRDSGSVPIVDQGKCLIAGYSCETRGRFQKPLPAVIFGDHTRRFKLIRFPFFLGADGAKILLPVDDRIDPVFLFSQLQSLKIKDGGYSRHFKFLKEKHLMIPTVERQLSFRTIVEIMEKMIKNADIATKCSKNLELGLTSRLLGSAA